MITLDNLAKAIEDHVSAYVSDITPLLEKRLDETALEIVSYIKSHAPRSGIKGAFADSFVVLSSGEGIHKVLTIYSDKKGRLTHLLELGFKHRGGKYIRARPFMRPAFDIFTPKMIDDLKEIISKGI